MQKVILDLLPGGVAPIVYASQYDDGRSIRFMLTNGGPDSQYSLNGNETITAELTKPDGTEATINVANPGAGKNYVDLVNGADDYDQAGVYLGEIVLTRNATVIGSANFVLKVEEDAYGGQITTLTATGNPCTFETNLADLLQSVKCSINPTQDLHGYDHPWPGGAGKNKFGGSIITSNCSYVNGAMANTDTDTRTFFQPTIRWYNGGSLVDATTGANIEQAGHYSLTAYINSAVDKIEFGHNGSARDIILTLPINLNSTITMSFDVTGYNPSNIGGLSVKNIQLEIGSTATAYEPYENVCPINGYTEANITRCGVNIWDEEWELGLYNSSDGTPFASNSYIRSKSSNYISVSPNTNYFICSPKTIRVFEYDGNYQFIKYTDRLNNILVMSENCKYIRFCVYDSSYGTTYNNDISINYPSTDTTYHAYNGHTYTIAFGQTVYGGVYDKSGRLTITFVGFDMGTAEWGRGNRNHDDTGRIFSIVKSDAKPASNSTIIADCFKYNGYQPSWENLNVGDIEMNSSKVIILCANCETVEELQQAFNGRIIAYELATPIVIDVQAISPSAVVGTNNVFGDTGDTEVKYLDKEAG